MGNTQSASSSHQRNNLLLPWKNRDIKKSCETSVTKLVEQRQSQQRSLDYHGTLFLEKLPPEIWCLVFSFLYPSELAQVTQVCRKFYHSIFNLPLWSIIHKTAFYFDRQPTIKLLRDTPALTSYALFVFANSLQICEQCFKKCDGFSTSKSINSSGGWDNNLDFVRAGQGWSIGLSALPLKVMLPWTKSGIRLCIQCRRDHFNRYPEPIPSKYKGKRLRRKYIRDRFHLCNEEIVQLKRFGCGTTAVSFCAEDALQTARAIYGGDVGIASVDLPLFDILDRSSFRVYVYEKRWDITNAGGTWNCIAP